jgi:hypothetical protein
MLSEVSIASTIPPLTINNGRFTFKVKVHDESSAGVGGEDVTMTLASAIIEHLLGVTCEEFNQRRRAPEMLQRVRELDERLMALGRVRLLVRKSEISDALSTIMDIAN